MLARSMKPEHLLESAWVTSGESYSWEGGHTEKIEQCHRGNDVQVNLQAESSLGSLVEDDEGTSRPGQKSQSKCCLI
jgi:hypothetical protein